LDGKVNPDVYKLDDQRHLESVTLDSEVLAIASLVFDDDAYAQKAADMLRYFFLNEGEWSIRTIEQKWFKANVNVYLRLNACFTKIRE
jgi:hypothetical protein